MDNAIKKNTTVIHQSYFYASLLNENLIDDTYSLEEECQYTNEEWGEVFDGIDD